MATKNKTRRIKKRPGKKTDVARIYEQSRLRGLRGRPRISYPFEQCAEMIKKEGLSSMRQYLDWWALNHPRGIPKRPDRAYKNSGWKGWNYFLGTSNEFSGQQKTFLPYPQAKKYVQKLKLTGWLDWLNYKDRPENIPSRPDLMYARTNEWEGWRVFLGNQASNKLQTLVDYNKIIYIITSKKKQNGLYYIGLFDGTAQSLKQHVLSKPELFHMKSFYYDNPPYDWFSRIAHLATSMWEHTGEKQLYQCNNIYEVINELSIMYPEVIYS